MVVSQPSGAMGTMSDKSRKILAALAVAAAAASPTLAHAHTGVGSTGGFVHGFAHPTGGLDHVLAMVAVGVFAACLGGRALWLVPSSFVAMMAVGVVLGINGVGLPMVEVGIATSVMVLGLAVAFLKKQAR